MYTLLSLSFSTEVIARVVSSFRRAQVEGLFVSPSQKSTVFMIEAHVLLGLRFNSVVTLLV